MATKSKTRTGYSKDIFERNGLWHANVYFPPADRVTGTPAGATGDDAQSLGTFSTQVQAERAAEDAVVAHMYRIEREEEDDKLRREQWEQEQDRLNAHNDRHLAARDLPDHKEPTATRARTHSATAADHPTNEAKAAAEQQHGTHEPA